jgi:uncharacterized protein
MRSFNLRQWLHEHSLKLLAIRDTPEAIAGGVTIGVFFGFMPLFGMKTVLALFFAWLTRSNIVAALLAGTVHDLLLPIMPIVYRWEYDLGFFLLSTSHHWPARLRRIHWEGWSWHHWRTFFSGIGKPLCLGGLIISAPFIPITFFVTRAIVARHQRKKRAQEAAAAGEAGKRG